jgi:Family of unknown function (DUF6951)
MPTSYSVDSGKCGHKTAITVALNDTKMTINITSTCPGVKKYSEALKEISKRDLMTPMVANPIYLAASSRVGPDCAVPCAVINAAWVEGGMVARSLLDKFGSICIAYKGGSD